MSENNVAHASGFVTIVGRPNVGKSTLLNQILGTKVAIVTPKPQTTRNRITGIATFPDCQVVFLDTPGIHEPKGSLNQLMVEEALGTLLDADLVIFVIDAGEANRNSDTVHPASAAIAQRIQASARPVILVPNKVDLVDKQKLLPLIDRYTNLMKFEAIIPISALKGDGVDRVLEQVRALLPAGERFYPDGQLTDRSRSFILSEFIREKVFLNVHQEIPYSVAVSIDLVQERHRPKPILQVAATIHVERLSQKKILVGRGASMLKKIGQEARLEIEGYLGRRIFLELFVRVEPEWTSSVKGIKKVGWDQ